MIYHGRFADDLPTLLREGGARLLVVLRGGTTPQEKAFAPMFVATRETFPDGRDKVALWPLQEYMRARFSGGFPTPVWAWLPGRPVVRWVEGDRYSERLFQEGEALTQPTTEREAVWVAMRYYFAWEGIHDGGLGEDAQVRYFEEQVETWKYAIGGQWTRLGVPHPASFAQIQTMVFTGV